MEIKYSIDPSIITVHTVKEILLIVGKYKSKYNLHTKLESVQLNPQFNVEGEIAWIIGESYLLFDEERVFDYVVSDKSGMIEFVLTQDGERYPHLKKEKTAEEIAEDEAFLQELRDEGFDIIE